MRDPGRSNPAPLLVYFLLMNKYTIGIDEAGRGPLAGPVSVGVACVPADFNWDQIPGVNDSKKLTEKKREEIFDIANSLEKEGKLQTEVVMVAANVIDEIGIVPSVTKAMHRALHKIEENMAKSSRSVLELEDVRDPYSNVSVKLDGGLKAPDHYSNQETIVKGDAKEKVIGLASIMAKVTRDRYMVQRHAEPDFAVYMFDAHKGYGTKKHREAIAQNGLSVEHRRSYCKQISKGT